MLGGASFTASAKNLMGFDLTIRDVDKEHMELRRVIWAGNNDDWKYTDHYGTLVLLP